MGRPVGSRNREMPFNSALQLALRGHPQRLRRIAEKLTEKAEEGDLTAIRELADRLDGKPTQIIDQRDAPLEQLSDAELYAIASGGLPRTEQPEVLLISPPAKSRAGTSE